MSTQNLGPQTFVPQFYHKSNMIDYVSGGKKKSNKSIYENDRYRETQSFYFFGKREIL